jgi:hypothetical protein
MLAIMLACRSDSSGSGTTTGSLSLTLTGVPAGAVATLQLTGPGGFVRQLTSSGTIAGLAPGVYQLAAPAIVTVGITMQGAPSLQSITVVAGGTATASVAFAPGSGTLLITVSGLPSDTAPTVSVTGPGGYSILINGNATLGGLADGTYTITAAPVARGTVTYQPSPSLQVVSISGLAQQSASFVYAPATTVLTLGIAAVYINQGAQRDDFSVPLVKDRPGLLRVFLRANQVNSVAAAVRVRFYNAGLLFRTDTIPPPRASVPEALTEGDPTSTWNLALPPLLLEPGVQLLIDVDPSGSIPLASRDGLTYPAGGTPANLDIRTGGTYNLAFVPVLNTADGQTGNVSPVNDTAFVRAVRLLHPMYTYSALVHPVYSFTGGVFQANDQNNAFTTLLQQLDILRLTEGTSYFYYGVVHLSYTSGEVGLGYINISAPGNRTAAGWDMLGADPLRDGSETYAHELGHNMGLFHAPCGGATSPDPSYPYSGGQVGSYGYNITTGTITSQQNFDLMGYCTPVWISDYNFARLIALAPTIATAPPASLRALPEAGWLVSGTVAQGTLHFNPVLQVDAPASAGTGVGPYRVTGLAADGSRVFTLQFAPTPVGDAAEPTLAQFAFVVPATGAQALDHLDGDGPLVHTTLHASAAAFLARDTVGVQATRLTPQTVRLRWATDQYPMLMVRDAATGAVLSLAQGGDVVIQWSGNTLAITASDGIRSRVLRLTP